MPSKSIGQASTTGSKSEHGSIQKSKATKKNPGNEKTATSLLSSLVQHIEDTEGSEVRSTVSTLLRRVSRGEVTPKDNVGEELFPQLGTSSRSTTTNNAWNVPLGPRISSNQSTISNNAWFPPRGPRNFSAESAQQITQVRVPPVQQPTANQSQCTSLGSVAVKHTSRAVYHPPHDFKVGVIFDAAIHTHAFPRPNNARTNLSHTHLGDVHSKLRKFVVIARFEKHVIALPIFTHEGNGLRNKHPRHKLEFVSVRSIERKNEAVLAETQHGLLWSENFPGVGYSDWSFMTNTTAIQFTAPQAIDMYHNCVMYGTLTPQSMNMLRKLWDKSLEGVTSVGETETRTTNHGNPNGAQTCPEP